LPEIGRIQSTNFQSLLTSLGITRNNIPFGLQSEVIPVVLVGGTVSFLAAPTPAYTVTDIFTAGAQLAPAAGFVLADTGPLLIGAFSMKFVMEMGEEAVQQIEWRNAGNTASLAVIRFRNGSDFNPMLWESRFDIQNDNERFRIVNPAVGGGGVTYSASILARV